MVLMFLDRNSLRLFHQTQSFIDWDSVCNSSWSSKSDMYLSPVSYTSDHVISWLIRCRWFHSCSFLHHSNIEEGAHCVLFKWTLKRKPRFFTAIFIYLILKVSFDLCPYYTSIVLNSSSFHIWIVRYYLDKGHS